jgi:hypothetical protein
MRSRPLFILALLAFCFLGAAKKPPLAVRFHCLANKQDGDPFTSKVMLGTPPRAVTIQKIPAISEKDIVAAYPYQAADGTWACAFKLDSHGTIGLDTLSIENRGSVVIAVVNGRVVTAIQIDRRVTDGIISIPTGLTPADIELVKKHFRILGSKSAKKSG